MNPATHAVDNHMYVTLRLGNQLLGISVQHVRDVLRQRPVTPIPLSPPEMLGVINLRGRIVTVIDLRRHLGMPARWPGEASTFVVIDLRGELYSLVVDSVGEVLTAPPAQVEKTPANLDDYWKAFATGIFTLTDELLVLVDVTKLISY